MGTPGATPVVVYSAPNNTPVIIKEIFGSTGSGGITTLTIEYATSTDGVTWTSAGTVANSIVRNVTVQSNSIFQLATSLVLPSSTYGDRIYASGAISLFISGFEGSE